jgi:uncharacterized protein YaaW (UPF0174 family)
MVGFIRGGVDLDAQVAEQIAHMPLGTMAVQALETADGPVVVGLEVGRAAIDCAGFAYHKTIRKIRQQTIPP